VFQKNFSMDRMISTLNSNEYVNSISHLLGTVLAIAGTTLLIVFSALESKWIHLVSFSIYGFTLILSMLFSTILHFNLLFGRYRRLLGILDHVAIYLLIAGSYTPFCLVILQGALGWWIFGIVWSMAFFFIALKSIFFRTMPIWFSQFTYLFISWFAFLIVYYMYIRIGLVGIGAIGLAGIFYTIGAFIFHKEKPDPWPPHFGSHEIWHFCVLAGNACIYYVMLFHVLPLPN